MNKQVNYSDTEKSIVAVLKDTDKECLTLAEISELVGKELKSGNINALVKKGNVASDHDITLVCPTCGHKKVVKGYSFVKDIE